MPTNKNLTLDQKDALVLNAVPISSIKAQYDSNIHAKIETKIEFAETIKTLKRLVKNKKIITANASDIPMYYKLKNFLAEPDTGDSESSATHAQPKKVRESIHTTPKRKRQETEVTAKVVTEPLIQLQEHTNFILKINDRTFGPFKRESEYYSFTRYQSDNAAFICITNPQPFLNKIWGFNAQLNSNQNIKIISASPDIAIAIQEAYTGGKA